MKISLDWLNTYLDKPIDADALDELLTNVGFPIESHDPVDNDVCLDVEITNNRGDCLSHIGIAREVAAASDRKLIRPDIPDFPTCQEVNQLATVQNDQPDLCPLYTARVIHNVRVAPSPDWLAHRLESVGLRPVNNIVDATNFVLMELGQPLHAFDLEKLQGSKIIIRHATQDEAFTAIDASTHKLTPETLVIADATSPVAIAGVMGGQNTEVTQDTKSILLESAQFNPLTTRYTSRAMKLASDSSYRFERGVDPEGVEVASRRATALIMELAGGQLAEGVIRVQAGKQELKAVSLRATRCRELMGVEIPTPAMISYLDRLGFGPQTDGDDLIRCIVPSHRLDVDREVDLIEEVARLEGFDSVGVDEKIQVVVQPEGAPVRAKRVLREALVAHGYHETITDSFLSRQFSEPFIPQGHTAAEVEDDRRKQEPALRPSVVPSLMICRKANQDAGNIDVRLFETAQVWSRKEGEVQEHGCLAILGDAPDAQAGLRSLQGTLVELHSRLAGDQLTADIHPTQRARYSSSAELVFGDTPLGWIGVPDAELLGLFGLQTPVVVAELDLAMMVAGYPPNRAVTELPRYPGIERDLSIIVDESVAWKQVEEQVNRARPEACEELKFVGSYRGKPIKRGSKSVTLKLRFRDPAGTLRHEDVDPQVDQVVTALKNNLGAQLRA